MADFTVTITIPDAKVATAKAALFTRHPKPVPKEGEEYITDKAHFENINAMLLNKEIRKGRNAQTTPAADRTDYFE